MRYTSWTASMLCVLLSFAWCTRLCWSGDHIRALEALVASCTCGSRSAASSGTAGSEAVERRIALEEAAGQGEASSVGIPKGRKFTDFSIRAILGIAGDGNKEEARKPISGRKRRWSPWRAPEVQRIQNLVRDYGLKPFPRGVIAQELRDLVTLRKPGAVYQKVERVRVELLREQWDVVSEPRANMPYSEEETAVINRCAREFHGKPTAEEWLGPLRHRSSQAVMPRIYDARRILRIKEAQNFERPEHILPEDDQPGHD